jgi:hypothetical protein
MKRVYIGYTLRDGQLLVEAQGDWTLGAGLRLAARLAEPEGGAAVLPLPLWGQSLANLHPDTVAAAAVLALAPGLPVESTGSVRFLFPVSAQLLAQLNRSAAWPRLQWQASSGGEPLPALIELLEAEGFGQSLAETLGLTLGEVRLALFGTSRLHRAFARRETDGSVRLQGGSGREALFARMGYFHSFREIDQAIALLQGRLQPPPGLLALAFRVENPSTTPRNEFDPQLLAALRAAEPFRHGDGRLLDRATAVAIEISSLRSHRHEASGTLLHANPNLLHDLPYSALYPVGYYERLMPWLGVQQVQDDVESLSAGLVALLARLDGRPLLVCGHLAGSSTAHGMARAHRRAQNAIVQAACARSGAVYVDTAPFVDRFGFAQLQGREDIHHLAPEGEQALGRELLRLAGRHQPPAPRRAYVELLPLHPCLDRGMPPPSRHPGSRLLWASLGENCLPDRVLQRHGLKSASTPFSHGRTNIDYALQLLHLGFAGWLDPQYLVSFQQGDVRGARQLRYRECEALYDPSVSRGFEFSHHDVRTDANARASLERKLGQLRRLAGAGDLVLLYHHRCNSRTDVARLVEKLERFATGLMQAPYQCRIFLMRQALCADAELCRVEHGRPSVHVDDFLFHTQGVWGGQEEADFWAERDDALVGQMLQQGREWGLAT